MSDPKLLRPMAPRVSTDATMTLGRVSEQLPSDMLRQASKRLSITAGVISMTYLVAWLAGNATEPEVLSGRIPWYSFDGPDLIAVFSIALSLSLCRFARRSDRDPKLILDVGMVYMVAICFGLALLMHWMPMHHDYMVAPILSWISPIMLIFAAIAPSTLWKTALAMSLAALSNPFAMLILRARGMWDGPLSDMIVMHYPDFILVPGSVIVSRVVTGMGLEVASAREMGSYRLGERIGAGAMGEVYRATHRMFARPAAIKLIGPDHVAAGDIEAATLAVKRFRREAEAAAQLRSPHTVALYDFGVTGDQTLYLVMELLDGMDLQTLVRQYGPVPANRAVHILAQVCESLDEAHASGLVHRDIKPANIHVGKVGLKHDFVKVLDFGLVKSLDGGDALESQATQEGRSPGTPAYMAPEAIRAEPTDGRTDIYALGCVAYFLLTGRLVFEAESGIKMIASHLQMKPVRPSVRSGIAMPKGLEDLVMRCLEKDADDRPAGADELGRELKALTIEPWTQAEAIAWWQQHRAGTAPRAQAS